LIEDMKRLPAGIWALGFVSLFMDISSEMIHGLLPVFLVTALGASPVMVGLIEGVGEATANFAKIFSGTLSDLTGKRKPLAILGYGLGALSKPFFALAPGPAFVLGARFADRVGKGLRGAPRDALVADLAPPGMAGAAYGLRQSLDSVGAFVGPGLAMVLMWALADNFRAVFWVAVIPGAVAVLILALAVREPPRPAEFAPPPKLDRATLARLPRAFWSVVAAGAVLTLARMSEAFAILRAEDLGLALGLSPMILVVMNIVSSAVTYPVGVLSDRIGRKRLLALGFGALIAAHLTLAAAAGLAAVFLGAALWGLHLALSQGLLSALVADTAPAELRGTAFGLFNLASGAALLAASLAAGALWETIGPEATFLAAAAFAALGLMAFLFAARRRPPPDPEL
jgi:MFS family permease